MEKYKSFKCPYCDFIATSYNGLCQHVFKSSKHSNITKEQLLTDFKYNGIRPTCKCGCGEYTTIQYTNGIHFSEYIQGHWNRIKNNRGHNICAIENSAKTRKEQYKSGKRVQWNKGKKWKETYSKEKEEELRNNLVQKIKKRIESQPFKIASKLEINFINDYIKPITEDFICQYYLKDINQFCDIYVPNKNLIIEVNGSYWHCDNRIYKNGPINGIQKRKIERDNIKYKYLNDNNYKLLIIWEFDIKNNPKIVKEVIEKNILYE